MPDSRRKQRTGIGMEPDESKSGRQPEILLAEDDREMRSLLKISLENVGFRITECADGVCLAGNLSSLLFPEGVEHYKKFDLIISDIRMPGVTGMSVLEGLQEIERTPPIILITAFGDTETHRKAAALGAAAMFDKPFEIEELISKAKEIISNDNVRREVRQKKPFCGDLL
jgi:two-component system, response regulator, stage 0 sporulation protein F